MPAGDVSLRMNMLTPEGGRSAARRSAGKIVILSGAHLCHNPRVYKEALTLGQRGFDVEVLGAWIDGGLAARDRALLQGAPFRFTPVLDLTGSGPLTAAHRQFHRARGRLAQLGFRWFNHASPRLLGYAAGALERVARSRQADLYMAHGELGLAAGWRLMQRGSRVSVDMEDWYSQDLLPAARRTRPLALLRQIEGDLLRHGAGATCPSRAMSQALAEAYACPPPVPIYNAFPWAERTRLDGAAKDRRGGGNASIHWFSQTLGPGRGLEDLFAALPHLARAVDLHLRGTPVRDFDAWLAACVDPSWRPRISVHRLVAPDQLLSRIAEHDIGFAGDLPTIRSRDLTVTNKILQYLLGGLAVVASDTAGQREVAEKAPGAVLLYSSGDSVALAAQLDALLMAPQRLQGAKAAALQAAQTVFCWERQEEKLLDVVERALATHAVAAER